MTHSQLIARLEQLTPPDREVDAEIAILLGEGPGEGWEVVTHAPGTYNMDAGKWVKGNAIKTPKPYTASVDAALALAEKVLPNTWNDILREALSAMSRAHYWHIEYVKPGQLTELPRQICIAILKAHGGSNDV